MTSQTCLFTEIETGLNMFFLQATSRLLPKLASKIWGHLFKTYKDMTVSAHVPKRALQFASEKTSVYRNGIFIRVCNLRNIASVSLCLVPF